MNILKYIDENTLNNLVKKDYKKNEIIYHENDKCDCVSIILKGKVIISTVNINGKEIIYNTINQSEQFGANLIVSEHPFYKGSVIAQNDTKIASMSLKTFISLLSCNNEFLIEYLKYQSDEKISLNMQVKLLSFDLAYDRLMYYLEYNNNSIFYSSITSLSNTLYMKRETLSRLLSKLEKERIISLKNKTITRIG